MAADMLGVSVRTLKNWEQEGKLHPRTGRRVYNGASREVVLYHPSEVAELLVKRAFLARARMSPQAAEGEIAARAFEYYGEGRSVVFVVMKLRITPAAADGLREQWERMGGVEMVIYPAAREELTRLLGPFDGVSELVCRVRERLASPAEATVASESEAREGRGPSLDGLDQDTGDTR